MSNSQPDTLLNHDEQGRIISLNLEAMVNNPALKGVQVPLVPDQNYIPDRAWSRVSIEGPLAYGGLDGKSILDMGSGTGAISIALNTIFNIRNSFGAECVPAAAERHRATNAAYGIQQDIRVSDVLSAFTKEDLKDLDLFVACIPQMPTSENDEPPTNLQLSDVYVPEGSDWDYAGLGLVDKFFRQANEKAPQAPSITTIHGRLEEEIIRQFMRDHDREIGRTFIEVTTAQDINTPLSGLAEREGDGQIFLLYSDPKLKHRITATEAESRRLAAIAEGRSTMNNVFHTVSSREVLPPTSRTTTHLPPRRERASQGAVNVPAR